MKPNIKLFRLLELTRAMPQYGYVLGEIPKSEISDLAQHHYLVTIMAWKLAREAVAAGGAVNIERVLEICLVHDLGELFGGDIAMPYARANKAARPLAKAFEAENYRFMAEQFGDDNAHVLELGEELESPVTDEGIIAKLADYIEVTHYRAYVHRLTSNDVEMIMKRFNQLTPAIKDAKTRTHLENFLKEWSEEMKAGDFSEIFEDAKTS